MTTLSKKSLTESNALQALLPYSNYFNLPERVLQFGTGVLLRGLPDFYIDQANKQGVFNGRIAVVKSTDMGDSSDFDAQDGMFTHLIRGIRSGETVDQLILNTSISRVITASKDWQEVLLIAQSPSLDIIISNTTEVGLTLVDEKIDANPPVSFPAKLLALLHKRFTTFKGDPSKGLVIIPTELIPNNGRLLKSICKQLADLNGLAPEFKIWLNEHNHFCDSLVDRIVPGRLSHEQNKWLLDNFGITDQLAILSEPYSLWAIEVAKQEVKDRLSFAAVNSDIILASDINKYRQLKLHLLNGTHTFCCGLAVLGGFTTVKEAMNHANFKVFMQQLILDEIIPCIISNEISKDDAVKFSNEVLDRFSNPFIAHLWQSITLNYSSKMRLRNMPILLQYVEKNNAAPIHISLAFAAMLLYLQAKEEVNGKFFGSSNGIKYPLQDDKVPTLNKAWVPDNLTATVANLLGESNIWGLDLNKLSGFAAAVEHYMHQLSTQDPLQVLAQVIEKK